MRKILAWFFTLVILTGFVSSCVPSGYEENNPTRPDEQQVPVAEDEGTTGGAAPAGETEGN